MVHALQRFPGNCNCTGDLLNFFFFCNVSTKDSAGISIFSGQAFIFCLTILGPNYFFGRY